MVKILLIGFVIFCIWIGLLLWDNYENYKWQKKVEALSKKVKKATNEIKLNWPEGVPRPRMRVIQKYLEEQDADS